MRRDPRYVRTADGLIHIQWVSVYVDTWQWPMGHMEASKRVGAVPCEETTLTCFVCVLARAPWEFVEVLFPR